MLVHTASVMVLFLSWGKEKPDRCWAVKTCVEETLATLPAGRIYNNKGC